MWLSSHEHIMKKHLSMLTAALALSACAVGTPINWDKARQVKVGMSESEVTALMGRPYMVSSRADGQRWIWTLGTALGGAESMSIVMREGKVVDVPTIPSSFK